MLVGIYYEKVKIRSEGKRCLPLLFLIECNGFITVMNNKNKHFIIGTVTGLHPNIFLKRYTVNKFF